VAVDTRFVAATNRGLREDVRQGRFRRDLFYRLNVMRIFLPPLRQRSEDVGPLLDHFLAAFAAEYRRPPIALPAGVRSTLAAYPWPGNVRELASWVERLYVTEAPAEALAEALLAEAEEFAPVAALPRDLKSLREMERDAIHQALRTCGNNQRDAARLLDIHRSTLARKLREYEVA
jgi:DNA-binding NtrC family response regulator